MNWLMPRSNPGALDSYSRPNSGGVSAQAETLPYGRLSRLLMLWLYAECARCELGQRERLDLEYALADFLLALGFESPAPPALREQVQRLLSSRFVLANEEVMPVTQAPMTRRVGDNEGSRIIVPLCATQAELGDALRKEMAERGLELCLHSLCAVQHCPFTLDVYLWDACYRSRALPGAPPARSRLAVYHALADHPSPWPSPDELKAFEHQLGVARQKLAQLYIEVHPWEDDIPFA